MNYIIRLEISKHVHDSVEKMQSTDDNSSEQYLIDVTGNYFARERHIKRADDGEGEVERNLMKNQVEI